MCFNVEKRPKIKGDRIAIHLCFTRTNQKLIETNSEHEISFDRKISFFFSARLKSSIQNDTVLNN